MTDNEAIFYSEKMYFLAQNWDGIQDLKLCYAQNRIQERKLIARTSSNIHLQTKAFV
jgi:hypothetical protein